MLNIKIRLKKLQLFRKIFLHKKYSSFFLINISNILYRTLSKNIQFNVSDVLPGFFNTSDRYNIIVISILDADSAKILFPGKQQKGIRHNTRALVLG